MDFENKKLKITKDIIVDKRLGDLIQNDASYNYAITQEKVEINVFEIEEDPEFVKLEFTSDKIKYLEVSMMIVERNLAHSDFIEKDDANLVNVIQIEDIRTPKNFLLCESKIFFFKKKAKTGVVMTLFMDWATY